MPKRTLFSDEHRRGWVYRFLDLRTQSSVLLSMERFVRENPDVGVHWATFRLWLREIATEEEIAAAHFRRSGQ